MVLRYGSEQLKILDRKIGIRRFLRRRLFYFGILKKPVRNVSCSIPVRITLRNGESDSPHNNLVQRSPSLLRTFPRAQRHSLSSHRNLTFGLLNVRSLLSKVDDVIEVQRDRSLDIFLLTETWHDSESVCIRRLRQGGFSVADVPRPRSRCDSLSTNHGGVAAISVPGVKQSRMPINSTLSTFEAVCVRHTWLSSMSIVLLIYRTGPVTSRFFSELSTLLESLATFSCDLFVVGDLNIHIERAHDPHAMMLLDLFSSFGFYSCVNLPTHNLGGTLDVVFSRREAVSVHISDPCLSDHCLLTWSISVAKPSSQYIPVSYRSLRNISLPSLRLAISMSPLCRSNVWNSLNVHDLAALYDSTLSFIIDSFAPVRTVRLRRRPSDPWFDAECRQAKRDTHYLERHVRRLEKRSAPFAALSDARFEWKQSLLSYRKLLRQKRKSFWKNKLSSEMHSPRDLWSSLNKLMGRGSCPSPLLSAQDLHDSFIRKVNEVSEATSVSSPPVFSLCDPSCHFSDFQPVSNDCITRIVQSLPNKSSSRDPLACHFLKACIDLIAPFLVFLFNGSLQSGIFPSSWKHAIVTPIPKKGKSDLLDTSSYRPISNLPLLSKVLEKVVSFQIRSYIKWNE